MKGKRLLVTLLAASLITCAFAGCSEEGGSSEPSGSTNTSGDTGEEFVALPETLENPDISIVYWYDANQYASDVEANPNVYDPILEAIPIFEEKYGGTVTVETVPWNDMLATATNMQSSGEAPDLIEVYDRVFHNVVLTGMVQPIDEYVTDEDFSYYKIDREFFEWENQTYAIPIKPYLKYIMYNRDLFDLEGLTHPDELFRNGEWTWDAFAEAGKALTKTTDGTITQWGFGGWAEILNQFMVANGSSLLNIDQATGTVTSNLQAEPVVNTINAFSSWMGTGGFVMIDEEDSMFDAWDNNKLAMIVGKEFPNTNPFDVGMVPLPAGPNADAKSVYVYPQAFSMVDGCANPAGAAAFMRCVNNTQKNIGDAREAGRYGQENYDMIYADDVTYCYAYDASTANIDQIISTILNYCNEQVPAATIVTTVEPELVADIELVFGAAE